ncbi:glucose-1-phosphate cytidylyltransferase [Aquiflexum sp. TKW24L]|uniref:glucose-1-phosphate cytidylyltransferase n=1 Tax=Aquiflexum sp. TKW24L TaxID=2942212 RepID=UPI0020BFAA88|nr:glucose-1-phosphate cytidylyltransferase [Aquiflexum sp. TKW24L]MCL6257703.1 glucose-1-phosphate cytidylyltransferase [Aquiflexum sp. TKW24L]
MKAVILAGGFGTRISEESGVRPKPMVEIGGKPILWHIMKIYSFHGINEFVICCGYKGHMIKEYFSNYFLYTSDVTFDLKNNTMEVHRKNTEPWRVTLIDTGENVMTGGRIKRVAEHLKDETFCLTYGDGVSDIDITASIEFHKKSNAMATLTAVQQPGRFGAFTLAQDESKITNFREKPKGDGMDNAWINGGFFIVEPKALDYLTGDDCIWERDPLENIAKNGGLVAFKHEGFWQPMDTLRDKNVLEEMWNEGRAPWKKW